MYIEVHGSRDPKRRLLNYPEMKKKGGFNFHRKKLAQSY